MKLPAFTFTFFKDIPCLKDSAVFSCFTIYFSEHHFVIPIGQFFPYGYLERVAEEDELVGG